MNAFARIGIWLGCVILAAAFFSAILMYAGSVWFIFRITLVFALPVGFLYLPFVLAIRDAEERRIWAILLSGILIGPASIALWVLILQMKGGNAYQSDGEGLSTFSAIICAAVVGLFTTLFYVTALKIGHRFFASRK